MSLDLFQRENAERMTRLAPIDQAEVGAWDGFIRGTAMHTMRGLVKTGSAIDLLGSVGPIVQDAFTGGTEAQDRYFREHDEVWGSAIDFWTPKPNEVGAAAEIAGTLLSTLPLVIANPGLAVGATQLSIAEELVKQGLDPVKAQAVGATQAFGLGLGLYVPIFGRTLTQRVLLGGAGFNVAQGIAMRTAGGAILKDTLAEGQFKAFDPTHLTLDVLLGAAFGSIVHLSPSARAQGEATWKRLEDWGKTLKPSDTDALLVLRQAQHANADSMPGRPLEPGDVERHNQRVKQAVEQLVRDEPVEVSDLPTPRFDPDPVRMERAQENVATLATVAEDVRQAEGLPRVESFSPKAARTSGVAGVPSITEATSPPGVQPVSGRLTSTRPEPPVSSTIRMRTPSERTGPFTTFRGVDKSITSKPILAQPDASPQRLLALADESKPVLEQTLRELSGDGINFLRARTKGRARLDQKLAVKRAENISDYLGARVSVDSPERLAVFLDELDRRFEVVRADDFLESPKAGYRAVHLDVRMPNGLIAEVQVIPKPVADIQGRMHKIYRKWRAVSELTPEQMRAKAEDMAFMEQRFRQAYEAWSESEAPATRAITEPPPPRGQRAGAGAEDLEGPVGRSSQAFTERGTEIDVRFRVVEAEDLITSHDDALRPRTDYPAEVQPRERGRAASEAQIVRIENNIRPELLGESPKASDGAPIVGPDAVVESGNARTIALRRAYGRGKADNYRAWLLENAERFGMNRAELEAMGEPVLVRERQTEVDRAAFAREANEAAIAQMSATELARADAARMPELDRLVLNEDGTINVRASTAFIRDFMESVPANERPALMTATGELSQAGLNRIRNAIFQRAYGDPDLVGLLAESTDSNIKNVLAGMLRVAGEAAKLREFIDAGARFPTTLMEDLAIAARRYAQLRAEGMTAQTFLAQGQMFDTGISPGAARLLEMFEANARSGKRIAEAIEAEIERAHGRGNPRQAGLFDEPLRLAAERVVAEQPDLQLRVGEQADGTPITQTAREYLENARTEADRMRQDAELFDVAARCLMGG